LQSALTGLKPALKAFNNMDLPGCFVCGQRLRQPEDGLRIYAAD